MSEHAAEPDKAHLPTFTYYVGADAYHTHEPELTGAQIKARIPNLEPGMMLTLEGRGDNPDRVIADHEHVRIALAHGQHQHFILVPNATFG